MPEEKDIDKERAISWDSQMVRHRFCKPETVGSTPSPSSMDDTKKAADELLLETINKLHPEAMDELGQKRDNTNFTWNEWVIISLTAINKAQNRD